MFRSCGASLALVLACRMATAQVATARLEGVVLDASGAVVPGARVSVVNTRTRSRTETTVSPEGLFAFPSLQPSIYSLNAEATGFRGVEISGLELNVGATVWQTVKLEIGPVTENVVVRANLERIQTGDAQVGRAVTLKDIDVLPQIDRMPIQLAIFNPGVQITPATWYASSRVNGTRQGSVNARLDGIGTSDYTSPFLLHSLLPSNTDSIEEFRIVTSGGKAEYGRSAGAQLDLVTRSGGNQVHGNVFEYLRNTVLNANTFFGNSEGRPRPVFIQNIFGASLGGPIRRNSTFIFANYQGQRTAQQQERNRKVLTKEAKAGMFRWQPPGSTDIQTFDIVRNDPLRRGTPAEISKILDDLPPEPNNDVVQGADVYNIAGFRFNAPAGQANDQFTVRADHDLWSGHRLFFRWTWGRTSIIDTINGREATFPDQPNGTQGGVKYGYSIGSDWAITPRLVNELRVGYATSDYEYSRPARRPGPMLKANSWTDPLDPAFGSRRPLWVHHVTDNLTVVRGRHILKAGIDLRFTTQQVSDDNGIWPNISFEPANAPVPASVGPSVIDPKDRATFDGLYNDLLGRVGTVAQTFYSDLEKFQPGGTPRLRTQKYREYAQFLQDDWKLHPRLVLNLGLRYEYSAVPREAAGFQGVVDKAALINPSARLADLTIQRSSRWYSGDFNNFAPRLGFAWDLSGSGKTALRANWGVFYERLIGATTNYVDLNTPGFAWSKPLNPNSVLGSDVRLSDGIAMPQPPVAPELRMPVTRSMNLALFTPNLRTGYLQHYSLTIQRELLMNTVIEAGYVGAHGTKLFMDLSFNQPRIYEDFLTAFRELQALRGGAPATNTLVRIFGSAKLAADGLKSYLDQGAVGGLAETVDRSYYGRYRTAGLPDFYLRNFPQFQNVVVGTNAGRSYYDSLQLSLRRQTGALKFVANYTLSKIIDNISTEGNGFNSPIDNFNVRLNRARGDYDIPHAFNSSFSYTPPFGRGRRFMARAPRWADSLVGGWDLGLLAMWQSGRVVSFQSGRATGPTTGSSFVNYTGDRNIGRVMRKGAGVSWLTPEEIGRFSYPAAGEIGTGGRNAFRGPRLFNVDISLAKKFKVSEQHTISFRAEAYNLFNNVNFGTPNADLSKPENFGKIGATVGDARVLQMALRYDF